MGESGVAHVTLEEAGDINADDIPLLQDALLRGDAVNQLVIDGCGDRCGKGRVIAGGVTQKAGLGAVIAQHRQRDGIQQLGRHAGLNGAPHLFMRDSNDAPSLAHDF